MDQHEEVQGDAAFEALARAMSVPEPDTAEPSQSLVMEQINEDD